MHTPNSNRLYRKFIHFVPLCINSLHKVDIFSFLAKGLSEIEQEMKKANMHIKLAIKKSKIIVLADKNLLWRAFENLIKDVFKHGKENSNVYISIDENEGYGILSIRNEIRDEDSEISSLTSEKFFEKYLADENKITSLVMAKKMTEKQNAIFDISIEDKCFISKISMKQK